MKRIFAVGATFFLRDRPDYCGLTKYTVKSRTKGTITCYGEYNEWGLTKTVEKTFKVIKNCSGDECYCEA